jgi:outer membrane protein
MARNSGMIPGTLKTTVLWMALLLPVLARAEEPARPVQMITLQECIARALAGNLDLDAERLNPPIADWGIVSAQSVYDPALVSAVRYDNEVQPPGTFRTETLSLSPGLSGKLPSGATYDLTAFDTRTLVSNTTWFGSTGVSVTQPLLRNFGFGVNSAQIRVARKGKQIADQNFVALVQGVVRRVVNAYYELVFAIEDHKAKLEDLNRAKRLLDENRQRVRIGVMSPLDVTQAEAGAAEREEAVIVAAGVIGDNEMALKRLIARDVNEFAGQRLVPTDAMIIEMVETDTDRSTRVALEQRPDFLAAQQELERRGIVVKFNRNQLWPQLDLTGSYSRDGLGGTFGRSVDDIRRNDRYGWGVGVIASFPLGNRQARANYNISRLDQDQAVISLKRLEQDIIAQVDIAVRQVATNLKRIEATAAASRLAEESLKAEEERLRAGASTILLVLQAQAQLQAARAADIRARADYAESLAQLAATEGTILQKYNVVLDQKR